MSRVVTFGKYTVVESPLTPDDRRAAHVTGPTLSGRIAPVASCWTFDDAVRFAKTAAAAEEGAAS